MESARSSYASTASGQGRTRRTFDLLWLILSRQLRLTWLLFTKELRELLVSRALWAMVLISAPLVGFSFIQAVRLYSQNSASALKLPQLAANQNPLDGIVIPVFSAVYLMNTFLFPFVAIRAIGNEKQTGSLKLALQLPVGIYRMVGLKLAALFVGWSIALIPTLSALMIWSFLLGGHLYLPELLSVLLGHTLYALVIAGVAFLAAALTESSATAAIVALAFTMTAWIVEFAGTTGTGLLRAVAAFSLTPALRGLEQGLVGSPTALALLVLAVGFLALTVVWLPPGVNRREKLLRSGAVAGIAFQALLLAVQLPIYMDVTEDQRNSFNPADARALSQMTRELKVDVNLASNDSQFLDLQRNVLAKLPRTAPHVTINYAEISTSSLLAGTSGANYGLNTYTYGGKQGTTRATTAREVLPLIEALGGLTVVPDPVKPYPGFPLVTSADGAFVWFYVLLPLLTVAAWWYFQQPPTVPGSIRSARIQERSRWPWLDPYIPALRRTAIGLGAGLFVAQFVPFGRDHTNIHVAPATPLNGVESQWCPISFAPGSESTMTLGAFRQQIGGMQSRVDASVGSLSSGNTTGLVAQYSQLAVGYAGVSKELAELYPIRCPRLLDDRVTADAAILGPRQDAAAASPALTGLRAGLASIAVDLDQRISQASPNGLVGNQDEAKADAPIVSGTPKWDSQQTQDLATRACAACHSNTPGWSWYSNAAPLSWLVQHNVDAGRAALNFSEWDVPQPRAMQAAGSVQAGSMPPAWARAIDSRLQLTDTERAELARGLQATFNTLRPSAEGTSTPSDGTNVVGAVGPTTAVARPVSAVAEDFTEENVGAAPRSFSTPIGWWSIGTDGTDPKPLLFEDGTRYSAATNSNSLAAQAQAQGQNVHQLSDSLLSYFPVALFNKAQSFTQGTVTTQFAVVGGDLDSEAGIVFDYQPNGDFLALREDMDESSLILSSVVQGQQSNLAIIENVPGALARWHILQLTVSAGGTHVTGIFDDQRLLDVDLSAAISGQTGVITKTDTVAVFNQFTVDPKGE